MAKYRKLEPRFWTDEKVRRLSPDGKLLAVYCLTGPQTNRIGLFAFSKGAAVEHLGLSSKAFEAAWSEVTDSLSWEWDEGLSVLYIPKFLACNAPTNDKHWKGMESDLDDIPKTPLLEHLRANMIAYAIPYAIPYAIGTRYPMAYQEQEQEQEQDQEQEKRTLSTPLPETSNSKPNSIPFEELTQRFNELCPSLPKVLKLTDQRKNAMRARWEDMPDLSGWADFFRRVEASNWLSGRTPRKPPHENWKVTLDYLLKPDVFTRVLEGVHDNKGAQNQASPHVPSGKPTHTRYEQLPDGRMLVVREEPTA